MADWIVADDMDRRIVAELEALGRRVDWRAGIERAELLQLISRYEGLVISSRTGVDRELVDRAGQLRIVARAGSGMEHVDKSYCASKGIACLSSPEGNCTAVAEHAFGMLLSLANHLRRAQGELERGVWRREENRGFELAGRTVGIIGYGHTGSAFAARFAGWQVRVLAYDKYVHGFGGGQVEEVSLEELQARSDIISFHVPLTAETRHWAGTRFLAACKPGLILINTSRGEVIHTVEVAEALRSGALGGLCIDVFEDEPIIAGRVHGPELYRELVSMENVVATPHIAGWTRESKTALIDVLAGKIARELRRAGRL